MEAVIERCCGLDVHQSSVVACIIFTDQRRKPRREIRTFGATTKDLETLREWLKTEGVTHVAMESTGVYWRPVHNLLHGGFTLIVANAHHIKNVPGRKTDVKDAEWIANLLRHGLINASYVPTPEIAELRDMTRYRRKLVGTASAERNRTLKLLETANIKLASVAADVFGVSGLAMLRALASGATAAEEMADLARGRMRRKLAPLAAALDGRVTDHHRFLLTVALGRLDALERDIALLDERIAVKVAPYDRAADADPGGRSAERDRHHRGGGRRSKSLGDGAQTCGMGWALSWQLRECWTSERIRYPKRQRSPESDALRCGLGSSQAAWQLSEGQVPQTASTPRGATGGCRNRAQDHCQRVVHPHAGGSVSGSRRHVSRSIGRASR